MLYHLFYPLHETFTAFNVFKYITFRVFAASLTALFISFLCGPTLINLFRVKNVGQIIRQDGPATHLIKKGTPTMGGLLILFSLIVSTLLWIDLSIPYLWVVLVITCSFGAIGFW